MRKCILLVFRVTLQSTGNTEDEMILESVAFCMIALVALKIFIKLTNGICTSNACLVGKTAIITGGNSGIGFETALNLASRGCRVIIADVIDSEESVKAIINETNNPNVRYKRLDLASLKSVRSFAADISETEERLDILINNAGCGGCENVYTDDGLLKVMQVNHYGHFLLTHLLLDLLKITSSSRVVFLGSCAAFSHTIRNPDRMNDPQKAFNNALISVFSYSNSKLCNLISARVFAQKLKSFGITCYSVHPGIVASPLFAATYKDVKYKNVLTYMGYFLIRLYLSTFGKTLREGAQTTLHCALSKDIAKFSGGHFWDCTRFRVPSAVKDPVLCEKLWAKSEELVELKPQEKISNL